jgi:hypothetical protein
MVHVIRLQTQTQTHTHTSNQVITYTCPCLSRNRARISLRHIHIQTNIAITHKKSVCMSHLFNMNFGCFFSLVILVGAVTVCVVLKLTFSCTQILCMYA